MRYNSSLDEHHLTAKKLSGVKKQLFMQRRTINQPRAASNTTFPRRK